MVGNFMAKLVFNPSFEWETQSVFVFCPAGCESLRSESSRGLYIGLSEGEISDEIVGRWRSGGCWGHIVMGEPSATISNHQQPSATISNHQQPSATISNHPPTISKPHENTFYMADVLLILLPVATVLFLLRIRKMKRKKGRTGMSATSAIQPHADSEHGRVGNLASASWTLITTSKVKVWTIEVIIYKVINPSGPNPGRREKIKLNFHFHTSLWCLKGLQGLKGLHKTFWGTTNKCENLNLT